ncbi:tyrosine-protein phosphatase [Streptomyces sp. MS19]|uniref:tyrosine-protein phosphatase n=1 Tax=Streptomyces sp. MS19 TaxID=3385972 RepID=UPI0039A17620
MERHLDWDGCFNARDLGGLPLTGGGTTRHRAVVRAESPERLTPAGWDALAAYGVRTLVDLREDGEAGAGYPVPAGRGIAYVRVPLDDTADTAFWQRCHARGWSPATPLYYRAFMAEKAARCAAALAAVARAAPGGVLVHCAAGRDRTGLVALALLALAGATADAIVADYDLSASRLTGFYAALGRHGEEALIQETLAAAGTTASAEVRALLTETDIPAVLHAAGLSPADATTLRARLTAPVPAP